MVKEKIKGDPHYVGNKVVAKLFYSNIMKIICSLKSVVWGILERNEINQVTK